MAQRRGTRITITCPVCDQRTLAEAGVRWLCLNCGFEPARSYKTDRYGAFLVRRLGERLPIYKLMWRKMAPKRFDDLMREGREGYFKLYNSCFDELQKCTHP